MNQKKKSNFTLKIFIGLVLGIILGLTAPGRADFLLNITDLFGSIYMNALRMIIYPMIFCSIVVGICNAGNMSATGKISGRAFLFFIFTTAFASLIGLVIPRVISLGKGVNFKMAESDITATQFTSILDTVKNLIPSNPVASFTEGNMLQILVFAMIIGFASISIGEKATPFLNILNSFNEICMKIITVVMHFTPIGVFCTIAPVIAANGIETIISLATALISLYIAFFVFAFIIYGGTAKIYGKISPFKFFSSIMPAALNAFGTCSSSATLPISKECAEEELGIDPAITSIVLPMGATINMDAVSILMSFMITFFANSCNIEVSISMMIIVLLANCLLSIGTPGVPGGAIASFAALSAIAGLPAGVMGVYISINTLCDMGATCVNVLGDLAATVYVQNSTNIKTK